MKTSNAWRYAAGFQAGLGFMAVVADSIQMFGLSAGLIVLALFMVRLNESKGN